MAQNTQDNFSIFLVWLLYQVSEKDNKFAMSAESGDIATTATLQQ